MPSSPSTVGASRLNPPPDEGDIYHRSKRLGCECSAEAIALFERAKTSGDRFDAVLLDLTVSGGMGGIETTERLRELDASAKLIVTSGYSDATVMSNFRKYGFDDVLPKPWTILEVSEVLRRYLPSNLIAKHNKARVLICTDFLEH